MFEKLIKKDRNEVLESVLEQKDIDERTKNLLQGILYKIEVSYKDYKIAKVTDKTEKQYVEEITTNISKKCNKITIVSFNESIGNKKIKESLNKRKFYTDNEQIVVYPIEEKLLYAIEKKTNSNKIINNKYELIAIPLSNLLMIGKSLDRVEPLRDFNGWSWTTLKQEIENVRANLVYQTLRILMGEEFLENWTLDTDGIIDYYNIFKEKITEYYGKDISDNLVNLISRIAILNEAEENAIYKEENLQKINDIGEQIKEFNNVTIYVHNLTEKKKIAEKEIAEIQKILASETNIKEEYKKRNSEVPIDKKIFSVKVLKRQLNESKLQLLNKIEEANFLLKPNNYMEMKLKILDEKSLLETLYYTNVERDQLLIDFENIFLKCFKKMIKVSKPEDIIKLIYKFRYYLLLPFSETRNIRNIEELQEEIIEIEKELLKISKKQKIISNDVPFEVWQHIFETRIIELEQLNYKIIVEYAKKYVQIFDENISEEKYLINNIEKNKINKKMKIFI